MIRSAVRTTLRSLLRSDLVAELNQTDNEVQRMDFLREETVPVSGCPGAQSSVVSTRRQQFKEGVCWM